MYIAYFNCEKDPIAAHVHYLSFIAIMLYEEWGDYWRFKNVNNIQSISIMHWYVGDEIVRNE